MDPNHARYQLRYTRNYLRSGRTASSIENEFIIFFFNCFVKRELFRVSVPRYYQFLKYKLLFAKIDLDHKEFQIRYLSFEEVLVVKVKQIGALIAISAIIYSLLTGCVDTSGETSAENLGSETTNGEMVDAVKARKVEKTAVQAQEARYIPIEEVGSYSEEIITPELLSLCTLPQLDKAALPYWTGLILEEKISVNYRNDGWDRYSGGGWYWNEEELRYMSENGFNCVRAVYSLSFLSHPEDVMQINVSELEQLDELIAWCIQYDMHLILAQTGLPGKWNSWGDNWHYDFDYWNTQENVGGNQELYTSKEMQEIYLRYYEMLAKRYQNIPNGVLSFELATENNVPENDMQLQADVLGPVAEMIWSYTPDRIVIVNDSQRVLPRPLAEMGCCISLHDHIYSIDGSNLELYGVDYEAHWPFQYLPSFIDSRTTPLVIQAEATFTEGELALYLGYRNDWPVVRIDGQIVQDRTYGAPVYESEALKIPIPAGAKEIEIRFEDEMELDGLTLSQGGEKVTLVAHGEAQNAVFDDAPEKMPTLRVNKDLSITDISETPVVLGTEYLAEAFLQPFVDTAKECGVSFLMTEVGTDGAISLSAEEYIAYEACWLDFLQKNRIGWMYNCIHNILAPEELMWMNESNSQFTCYSDVLNMYGYRVNTEVMDFLRSYSAS